MLWIILYIHINVQWRLLLQIHLKMGLQNTSFSRKFNHTKDSLAIRGMAALGTQLWVCESALNRMRNEKHYDSAPPFDMPHNGNQPPAPHTRTGEENSFKRHNALMLLSITYTQRTGDKCTWRPPLVLAQLTSKYVCATEMCCSAWQQRFIWWLCNNISFRFNDGWPKNKPHRMPHRIASVWSSAVALQSVGAARVHHSQPQTIAAISRSTGGRTCPWHI